MGSQSPAPTDDDNADRDDLDFRQKLIDAGLEEMHDA